MARSNCARACKASERASWRSPGESRLVHFGSFTLPKPRFDRMIFTGGAAQGFLSQSSSVRQRMPALEPPMQISLVSGLPFASNLSLLAGSNRQVQPALLIDAAGVLGSQFTIPYGRAPLSL